MASGAVHSDQNRVLKTGKCKIELVDLNKKFFQRKISVGSYSGEKRGLYFFLFDWVLYGKVVKVQKVRILLIVKQLRGDTVRGQN